MDRDLNKNSSQFSDWRGGSDRHYLNLTDSEFPHFAGEEGKVSMSRIGQVKPDLFEEFTYLGIAQVSLTHFDVGLKYVALHSDLLLHEHTEGDEALDSVSDGLEHARLVELEDGRLRIEGLQQPLDLLVKSLLVVRNCPILLHSEVGDRDPVGLNEGQDQIVQERLAERLLVILCIDCHDSFTYLQEIS